MTRTNPMLSTALTLAIALASACKADASAPAGDIPPAIREAMTASGTAAASAPDARPTGGKVAVVADEHGFTPGAIKVKKGEPLVLVFTRTNDTTCTRKVVFPSLTQSYDLPLDQPVAVTIPTVAAGTIGFECQMAMFKSTITVE